FWIMTYGGYASIGGSRVTCVPSCNSGTVNPRTTSAIEILRLRVRRGRGDGDRESAGPGELLGGRERTGGDERTARTGVAVPQREMRDPRRGRAGDIDRCSGRRGGAGRRRGDADRGRRRLREHVRRA